MKKLLSFGLFGFLTSSVYGGDNAWCDNEEECAGETLDYENVYCPGYLACEDADITSEENTVVHGAFGAINAKINCEYNMYCYGPFSCMDTNLNITNDFYNYGLASLYDTTAYVGDDYFGHGAYSGYGATIRGNDEDGDYSYVYGFMGGAFSSHKGFYRLYAYGFLSMYYADITSKGDGEETNYLIAYGYYATYLAEYTCQSEDYCYIYCDGVGCEELTVYIEDGATYNSNCDDDCAICPTFSELDSTMNEYKKTNEYKLKQEKRQKQKEWISKQIGFDNVIKAHNKNKESSNKLDKSLKIKENTKNTKDLSFKGKVEASKEAKEENNDLGHSPMRYMNRKTIAHKILNHHNINVDYKDKSADNAQFVVINDIGMNNNKIDLVSYGIGLISTIVTGIALFAAKSKLQSNKA